MSDNKKSQIRAYSLEHAPHEDPVYIREHLSKKNIDLISIHLWKDELLPRADEVDLLIIMGGPMNIYQEDKYPWLKSEKVFIKELIAYKIPILGICLGSQLLSDALSGTITPAQYPEYGWVTIKRDDNSQLPFQPIPDELDVFQWHEDTFSIPPGATPFYQSERCKNQAFIFQNQIIGLQFHPEMDEKSIRYFINEIAKEDNSDEIQILCREIFEQIAKWRSGPEFLDKILTYLVLLSNS